MVEQPYDKEEVLQELLATHPRLLQSVAGPSVPNRWLLIAREAQLPSSPGGPDRWAVDHLFVDRAGVPTIVEVKRSSNTQIRREVVGQMLDYAANAVVYWPIESLIAKFEGTELGKRRDSHADLIELVGSPDGADAFWQTVKTNLQAGKVRLVFVADAIPPELQRIVEFLNGQMTEAEVLAIEVKQYRSDKGSVLVPRLIGRTASAERVKRVGRTWDRPSLLEDLRQKSGEACVDAATRLMNWVTEHDAMESFGQGLRDGSWTPSWEASGRVLRPITLWSQGSIEILFEHMPSMPPFDRLEMREELRGRLNAIPGVRISPKRVDKRPNFPLTVLTDDACIAQFEGVLDWTLSTFRDASPASP